MQNPWLLVLDNADDPDVDYQVYFPPDRLGVVMLTTRNDECNLFATEKIALDGLSDPEARDLLLRAADVPRDRQQTLEEEAQVVASLLHSHPLAIIQAGTYVSRGHCTLAEYPQVYGQRRKRLLKFGPTQARSRYHDVYATFEASWEILHSSHTEAAEDALDLLPVLATCGPSPFPLSLFETGWKGAHTVSPYRAGDEDEIRLAQWHVSRLPSFNQADADAWDDFRLIEAINLLKAFALVSTDTYNTSLSVSMHPLIYAWARDRLDALEQHTAWLTTGCLFAISSDDHFWFRYGGLLQPHLRALTLWDRKRMFMSQSPSKITSILLRLAWLLGDIGDDAKLFDLLQNLSHHLSLDQQAVDESWLPLYFLNLRYTSNSFKFKATVSILEKAVKIKQRTLAQNDSFQLALQESLARSYIKDHQHERAALLLEQVINIKEQALTGTKDSASQMEPQHLLACACLSNRQTKRAVLLLEQVVKSQEQTLTEDFPHIVESKPQLANAYQGNRHFTEALSLLEQVVRIKQQILVRLERQTPMGDHPYPLTSQQAEAYVCRVDRQIKKAVSLLLQVVTTEQQVFVEDHPPRLESDDLVNISWDSGPELFASSLRILEHVVEIQRQILDKDHPDLIKCEARLEAFKDEM